MLVTGSTDTICAISTAGGVGGIAVMRVSGPEAVAVVGKLWRGKSLDAVVPRTAHLGDIADSRGETLDTALVTLFRAPASFTGEDVVEISVHGSLYIQQELLEALTAAGARMAEPGEFTRRAFANRRMDLSQAEAVADVIAANSRAAHRLASSQMRGSVSTHLALLRSQLLELTSLLELELDFGEEHVEFASRERLVNLADKILREVRRLHGTFTTGNALIHGIPVAIVGATNAGKSSLLNALLGDDRAIVSDIHGTTRDTVDALCAIGPYAFRLTDTAGLRDTADAVERLGIERSHAALRAARFVIFVVDRTVPVDPELLSTVETERPESSTLIIALNKSDLPLTTNYELRATAVELSATTGEGIEKLKQMMISEIEATTAGESVVITNRRHADALASGAESLEQVLMGLRTGIPADLVAADLRMVLAALADITGDAITTPEVLRNIFSRFCVGK